jgi:cyclophilin family peptidyl-prolyl cis-trans isomerase
MTKPIHFREGRRMRRLRNSLIVLSSLLIAGCAGNGDGNLVSDPEVPTAPADPNANQDAPHGPLYGMACVDALFDGYGEGAPRGFGPDQGAVAQRGNEYLNASFPKLDYIKKASIVEGGPEGTYRVLFETSKGDFTVEVHEDWAPRGAARFRELVEAGFYDDCRFFRVIKDFMAQVGMNGDPEVQARWQNNTIPDDPVVQSNTRGRVTFATSGPNSRTCQFFINFGDNSRLDSGGFAPIGEVIDMAEEAATSGAATATGDSEPVNSDAGNP